MYRLYLTKTYKLAVVVTFLQGEGMKHICSRLTKGE